MPRKTESRTGSVFRDKKTGRWHAQWREADYTGKVRTYRSTTNTSRAKATEALGELKERAKLNSQPPRRSIESKTVGEWLDKWHEARLQGAYTRNSEPLRVSSAQVEKRHTDTLKALIGDRELRSLTSHDVTELFERIRADKAGKNRTIRILFLTLRKSLGDVRPRLPADLFSDVDTPKVASKEVEIFDIRDLRRVLAAVDRPRPGDTIHDEVFAAIVHVLANTGMRIGECLALHWSDIGLDSSEIHVRASVAELTGLGVSRGKTKTGKSRRVPIPSDLVGRLRALRAYAQLPWVFSNDRGEPLRASKVLSRRLHPVLDELGLDRCGFHRFRHTYASIQVNAGLDIITLSKLVGHAKPSITLDVYGHLIPGREKESVGALESVLSGLSG